MLLKFSNRPITLYKMLLTSELHRKVPPPLLKVNVLCICYMAKFKSWLKLTKKLLHTSEKLRKINTQTKFALGCLASNEVDSMVPLSMEVDYDNPASSTRSSFPRLWPSFLAYNHILENNPNIA
jgi:hypothetical protein